MFIIYYFSNRNKAIDPTQVNHKKKKKQQKYVFFTKKKKINIGLSSEQKQVTFSG